MNPSRAGALRAALFAMALALAGALLASCGGGKGLVLLPRPLPAGAPSGEIAVRVLHGASAGTVVVAAVRIDGQGPYPFLVDTGAAVSVIDPSLAKSLNLPHAKAFPGALTGVACSRRPGSYRLSHWKVGRVALPADRVAALAVGGSGGPSGIRGLLGSDVLSRMGAISIDYRSQRAFLGPAAHPRAGRSARLRVVKAGGEVLALASVTVGGQGPYPFIVDTGASRSVVSKAVAGRVGLHVVDKSTKVSGVSCQTSAAVVAVKHWKAGSVPLPAGKQLSLSLPAPAGRGPAGLIGSNVLATFGTATIDYAGQRLILGNGAGGAGAGAVSGHHG